METAKRIIDEFKKIEEVKQIGISGGEPFLFFEELLDMFTYSYAKHGFIGTVNTNASWAKTYDTTKNMLELLHMSGVRYIGISVDSFHQEFVSISNIQNVIQAASELTIKIFVQTIKGENTWNKEDVIGILGASAEKCTMVMDTPLTVTRSSSVRDSELPASFTLNNGCTMLRLVQSDQHGNIRFCCGPAECPAPPRLIAGNVFEKNIPDILAAASLNPIYNSLFIHGGPSGLMLTADRLLGTHFMNKQYTSCCDACNHLLQSPAIDELHKHLQKDREKLAILRKYKTEIEFDTVQHNFQA